MTTETLVKLSELTKLYQSGNIETTALAGINLEIQHGEFIAIQGPSGCGKSTLLNIVGMLDSPSCGKFLFEGEDIAGHSEARLASLRKKNVGFVFQSFNLIDDLTVAGNIELALIYHKVSRGERKRRVAEAMDRMGITHRAQHHPPALSGGQQQRVAVARAVVSRPRLILADEPTGNLDSEHGGQVMQLLRKLNDSGTTIAMVTHSRDDASYARRILHLLDGQVVSEHLRSA